MKEHLEPVTSLQNKECEHFLVLMTELKIVLLFYFEAIESVQLKGILRVGELLEMLSIGTYGNHKKINLI